MWRYIGPSSSLAGPNGGLLGALIQEPQGAHGLEVILGPCWAGVGSMLIQEPQGAHGLEVILGPCWAGVGSMLGADWAMLVHLGFFLAQIGKGNPQRVTELALHHTNPAVEYTLHGSVYPYIHISFPELYYIILFILYYIISYFILYYIMYIYIYMYSFIYLFIYCVYIFSYKTLRRHTPPSDMRST